MDVNIQSFNKSVSPICERYYGETKDITEFINILGEYRHKYWTDNALDFAHWFKFQGAESDPLLLKLIDKMKYIWGFTELSLLIVPSMDGNAMTFGCDHKIDKNIMKSNKNKDHPIEYTINGPKYKKEYQMSCIVIVFTGIIFNKRFTDREVAAIIIHEIGHNFQSAIMDNTPAVLFASKMELGLLYLEHLITSSETPTETLQMLLLDMVRNGVLTSNTFGKIAAELQETGIADANKDSLSTSEKNTLKQYNAMIMSSFSLYMHYEGFKLTYKKYKNMFKKLIGGEYLDMIKWELKSTLDEIWRDIFPVGYKHEEIADSFATDLGLGPEIASGMEKFKDEAIMSDPFNLHPVLRNIKDLIMTPFRLINSTTDEHPREAARIENALQELLTDYKYGYFDPSQKSKIEADIAELRRIKKLYMTMQNAEARASVKGDVVGKRHHQSNVSYVNAIVNAVLLGAKGGIRNLIIKLNPTITGFQSAAKSKEKAYQKAKARGDVIESLDVNNMSKSDVMYLSALNSFGEIK